MKYPQLVSPRAVNAISDWLVSRLEQLGVESPQIYTRLLLSLLQSSVQVNDPIEFSNLEAFFAQRKGGHKRFHLPSDTETLKKLNAVQCLREIVSNEQETATIEQLVDELCEKLKDIEKQTQNLSDEERFLIETHLNTDSLIQQQQTQTSTTQVQQQASSSSSSNNHHTRHQQQAHTQQHLTQIYNNSHNSTVNSDSKRHHQHVVATTTADSLNDLDNDPKKRYFRAFPALSKEMEDSFRIWRRNAKSLTWPVVGRSIVVDSNSNNINNNNNNNTSASLTSSSASSIISSSNFGANNNNNNRSVSADKSVEKKLKAEQKVSATVGTAVDSSDVQQQQHQGAVAAAASVKKKSKRRRNQALCKGKTIQNIRKLSVGTNPNSIGGNKYHHYTHHRNSSPAWDTDFKGCWEMGPDLIKEFLSRQNAGVGGGANKRNRSNSDSMDHEEHNVRKILNEIPAKEEKPLMMKPYIDLSFCCDDDEYDQDDECQQQYTEEGVDYVDEDYDDNTLASVSELAMDSLNPNPKRLYQREGQGQKSNLDIETCLEESNDSVDPLDFQQFKAKFNSSVEALWKNAEPTPNLSSQPTVDNSLKANNPLGGGISSAFYATTSLNALVAPFKKDLWNFWSNYQQQNYDHQLNNKLSSTASTSSMITNNTRLDDSSASSGAGADIANSSDYFSMPSNLDDFDKSVGGVRGGVLRTTEAGASLGAHTPSINVFLQNSIWSTSGDCVDAIGTNSAAGDTDESFLYKVWHSNKKLSQLDVGNAANGEKMSSLQTDTDGGISDFNKSKDSSSVSLTLNNQNLGANLQFPPYQSLKWSEGINAGPPYNCLLTQAQEMDSLRSDNNNLASYSSAANITGATWEAPAYGHNAQPDLKSWCASNPMSLTEMYGNDVCDSIVNQEHGEEAADMVMGPAVTLPNHCANTSGFVAYSRIKQCGLVQPQTKPLQSSNATRLPKDFFRSGEEENLLNSERTHFHPIENFVDGHTFDISNALDTVEFERTSSGLLRYDSEEYLEYTRNDIYMADEEVATSNTNLLKYGRKSNEENKNDNFVIKFRVKRSGEIACQTEEQDFQLAAAKMVELPTAFPTPQVEVTNMFNNTFSLSRQANNEAIMAAVTKAVAAAAKAAAENHLNAGHFNWTPGHNMHNIATVSSGNSMENNTIWMSDNAICDEVDFCAARVQQQQPQLAQNWSMNEVEKQCHQRRCLPQEQQQLLVQQQQQLDIKRKFPSNVEMERSEENSLDSNSLHTLWGMCAVCNSCEYGKSLPANRLLRDELQLEADEIMSDLRYMQDLYIGETTDILTDTVAGEMEDKMFNNTNNKEMSMDAMKNPWNCDIKENVVTDPMQVSMLQKVNQLIEDLLKPDNNGKLTQETDEYKDMLKQTEMVNNWNLTAAVEETNTKNLWQFNDKEEDNNIWQHKPLKNNFEGTREKEGNEIATTTTTNFMKPMKLLKQVGGSLSEDTQYMETLNWEHDNLAKIWQQTTTNIPSNIQLEEEMFNKNKQNEMANNIIKENLPQNEDDNDEDEEAAAVAEEDEDRETLKGTQKLVEEKNLKNLQNINALTPPSTLPGNSYKRMQNFLNNSAAKLKLAANRKRRHSASQNFYQQQQQQQQLHYSSHNNNNNNIHNNNNNNDNITDLNAYKQKLNETLKAAKEQQQQQLQEVTPYNSITNLEEQPTKQTIITCKYWTTATNGTQSSLDSAAAAMMLLAAATNANDIIPAHNYDQQHEEDVMLEENIFGNTFSCLIDKNASILKHVTMMTRPLTR
ncbi:uncharacterized protein DDB_G0283357-like isoform X1 [Lucilia sericata]|uniref:uncharacterized protein DDB_G0283357-like isoform X1 n=2 Tax=Lucilia sericata TaxID=13632 RepID=UPI0018A7F1B5|nr:uncharacterized protein DDB_G0283357-like isoform X1 [Lucilia sericata]XP_037817163.1 uncharacterized protein DDB_G0283357-like isoform X1 [Lucilia sericata]XP_037817164.1 uncharacterized protein DDB_G0283357-like isoform X1 [Lucilia sericata]XP_037817165.1 uncharacterized protein DDB_G0283357-like isoform X1 [Lucilia sericata]